MAPGLEKARAGEDFNFGGGGTIFSGRLNVSTAGRIQSGAATWRATDRGTTGAAERSDIAYPVGCQTAEPSWKGINAERQRDAKERGGLDRLEMRGRRAWW